MSRMSRQAEAVAPLDVKVAAAAKAIRNMCSDPFTILVQRFGAGYAALGLDPAEEIERVTSEAMAVA